MRLSRWSSWLKSRPGLVVPVIFYLVLVAAGATWSSLGVPQLREDASFDNSDTVGRPQGIRSDEWRTQTGVELAVLANGHSDQPWLSQEPDIIFQISSGQVFESIFFFEGNLLRLGPVLPDSMLLPAFRLFHWLLLLWCLPLLLQRFGATTKMSWLATTLCLLAPAAAWWSFTPVRIMGIAAAGSLLLVLGRDQLVARRRWRGLALAGVGGMLLGRMLTYYVPWQIVIALSIAAVTGLWLLAEKETRRQGLAVLAFGALFGGVMLGLVLWENWDALQAELNTAYPGARRMTGTPQGPMFLFGAPAMWAAAREFTPTMHNQTELATAYTVCVLWALVLVAWIRRVRGAQAMALWSLAGFTGLWLAWSTVNWGTFGLHLPGLNLVGATRSAQTVGFLAAPLVALVLSHLPRELPRRIPVLAGVATGLATGYGASDLQFALPGLDALEVWVTALGTGLAVWVVTRWRDSWWSVGFVVVLAVLVVARVNPIQFGLGDLRGTTASEISRVIGERAESDGKVIATVQPELDVLTSGSGAPSLTGFQTTGPDQDRWEVLDPERRYEFEWNRASSYLTMSFDRPEKAAPVVTIPSTDVISVSASPCWLVENGVPLGYVFVRAPLEYSCVEQVRTFEFGGSPVYVYSVEARDDEGAS